MTQDLLSVIELQTGDTPDAAVIWLHGLGADGNDFVPVAQQLNLPAALAVRFVFPNAPIQAVTINAGMPMPAWYDIVTLGERSADDEAGIRKSADAIARLVARERERGVASERVVIAGFSQGGAIALHAGLRYPDRLAGIMALSTYLPLQEKLEAERSDANHSTPIFMAHGTVDPTVLFEWGAASRDLLRELGYRVEWHEYMMEHAVNPQEIVDIRKWLLGVLG
ncbi:MAG: alpha/beta hydrolase [Gammaproteobacteria bacterium]